VVDRAGGRPLRFATTPSIATASPWRSRLTATERCPLRKQNEDRTSAAETPSPPHATARLKIRSVVPPSRDGPAARWFEFSVGDERIGLPDPSLGREPGDTQSSAVLASPLGRDVRQSTRLQDLGARLENLCGSRAQNP
jgi:hypothetical protein